MNTPNYTETKNIGGWIRSDKPRMIKDEKMRMVYGYVKGKNWAEAKKEIDEVCKKYRV